MKKVISIFFATIVFLAQQVSAVELFETNLSIRALGMGNAFTAIADDNSALFYNPAALSNVGGFNWTIFDLGIGANGLDVVQQALSITDGGGGLADTLGPFYGKKISVLGGAKTAFTTKGFAVAFYDWVNFNADLSNPAFPNFDVNFTNDYGIALGFSMELFPGFSLGIGGRKLTRMGARLPIGISVLGNLSNQDLINQLNSVGTGFGMDLGALFKLPSGTNTTFSFVWKNVGITKFNLSSGTTAPPPIDDELIAGFAMGIDLPGLDIKPVVDFKNLGEKNESLGKKVHVGVEFDFPFLDVRAGMHQGYWTLGAGFDINLFRLDLASYGVELGEYPGQDQDRRWVLQMTLELGFDPNFSFLGSSSGTRSLKQRR